MEQVTLRMHSNHHLLEPQPTPFQCQRGQPVIVMRWLAIVCVEGFECPFSGFLNYIYTLCKFFLLYQASDALAGMHLI